MPRLEPPQSSEPLRLLIADDDPMIPEMLAERLKLCFVDQAVEIYQVASAEEALKLLFEQPIDLLLTDYDFSQGGRNEAITGLALLRQIREHRIVVTTIFMTGFGDEEVAKTPSFKAPLITSPSHNSKGWIAWLNAAPSNIAGAYNKLLCETLPNCWRYLKL